MLRTYRRDQLHSIVVERGAPGCRTTCFAPGAVVRPQLFDEDRHRLRIPVGLIVWAAAAVDALGSEVAFGVLWSSDPDAGFSGSDDV